jgi:hydroxyacylglutathione hydrolase
VDTRPADRFAAAYLPGSINIPFNKSFVNWAGSIVPADRDIYLIVDAPEEMRLAEARSALQLIGLDRVAAYASAGALERMSQSGEQLGSMPQVEITRLSTMKGVQVLDVRTTSEHSEGHIPGSKSLALQSLASTLDTLDPAQPIAIHCAGGTRSSIAASLLASRGFKDVTNVTGGFGDWAKAGLPVEKA